MVSHDSGDTWRVVPWNKPTDIYSFVFLDDQIGYIVGEHGMIMETLNAGDSWQNHYTGSNDTFISAIFNSDGHSMVLGTQSALESLSNGHNSSWFNCGGSIPFTAVESSLQYAALLSGDILDRNTGISTSSSSDPIYSFHRDSKNNTILGAGRFGRIIKLTAKSTNKSASKQE